VSPARVVVVTGTGTEIGKTVTTAALAAAALADGRRVAVVKPVQTGLASDEPGDLDAVGRLTGVSRRHELARLPDPLAPDTAARVSGRTLPTVAEHASAIATLARTAEVDLVLVEGAGGLLVRLDGDGHDISDLAALLVTDGLDVDLVVVAAPGLGTLNHCALTAEAIRRRGLPCSGIVVGSWPQPPDEPDLAMRCNLADLPSMTGLPVLAVLPAGAGSWPAERFRREAPAWFDRADGSGQARP
jgi:dethiobiotin synthetase